MEMSSPQKVITREINVSHNGSDELQFILSNSNDSSSTCFSPAGTKVMPLIDYSIISQFLALIETRLT